MYLCHNRPMLHTQTKQAQAAYRYADTIIHNTERALSSKEKLVGRGMVLKQGKQGLDLDVVWRFELPMCDIDDPLVAVEHYTDQLFYAGETYGRLHGRGSIPDWVMVSAPMKVNGIDVLGIFGQSCRVENLAVLRTIDRWIDDDLRVCHCIGQPLGNVEQTHYHAPLSSFWDGFESC